MVEASPGQYMPQRRDEFIIPATRESDEIGSILVQEAQAHAPEYGERKFRTFVYSLMQKVDKKELNLRLDDGDHIYRLTFPSPIVDPEDETPRDKKEDRPDMLATLHIRDKAAFMEEMANVSRFIGPGKEGNGGMWAAYQDVLKLFRNATPYDFEHPEQFFREQAYALEDDTFREIAYDWNSKGILAATGERFSLWKAPSDHEEESAYELRFRLGENATDEIPAVRYARVNPDTAIVYAVQMPFIDGYTEWSLKENINSYSDKDGKLAATLAKFPVRKEKIKRLNKHMKRSIRDTYGTEVGQVPGELMDTPPAAVVSLAAGLAMLQESGIKEVKIPTFLPWRQHADMPEFKDPDGEIDRRILDQNVKLMQRVMHEVEGIELSSGEEEDGYIHLSFVSPLRSQRPILSDVMELSKEAITQRELVAA